MKSCAPGARQPGARGVVCVSLLSLLLFTCMVAACEPSLGPKQSPGDVEAAQKNGAKKGSGESNGNSARPKVIARLEDASIDESSGLAASRRNPDLFWTHNDSGDDPVIFAFDRRGRRRGVWRVEGAKSRDWEDIAVGPGPERGRPYIFIGDIGDNGSRRKEIIVYRIPEPAIEAGDAQSSRSNPRLTEAADAIRMQYPDGTHDAETLMVHPSTGDIYIATKVVASSTGIYKLSAPAAGSSVNTLAFVGEVSIPGSFGALLTGGDISPDGRRAVLCDYFGAYELQLPAAASDFDAIWKQPAVATALGIRGQGEAVCYRLDGAAILATSEGRNSPLVELELLPPAPAGTRE